MERFVENGTRRIAELDKLFETAFERNVLGKLEDDRYERMVLSYEKEQKELIAEVAESQRILEKAEQQVVDLRLLLRTLREMTDVKELTPTLVNSLIERIEVHNNDKSSGHCYVKVDIYFTAAGMIDIPTEEEILAMMAEIRKTRRSSALWHKEKTVQPLFRGYTVSYINYFLTKPCHLKPCAFYLYHSNPKKSSSEDVISEETITSLET